MPLRASFFIDGFNVYHSIKAALADGAITHGRWLDYRALCTSYLGLIGPGTTVSSIQYFSALAWHRPGDAAKRHKLLMEVMKDQGIEVILGNFKRKDIRCQATCHQKFVSYEEKETDLNIGLRLMASFHKDECDVAVIISGDTDLLAVVREALTTYPTKEIVLAFPYKRHNNHYRSIAPLRTIKIPAQRYEDFQLADPVRLISGRDIAKPVGW
ncbi:MAG: NYN domain-containing protein [Candidatus Obscuribacterales bacterium]|nr:NYN domain-containing protein [Candidatus Obscuribacterales bacterium]